MQDSPTVGAQRLAAAYHGPPAFGWPSALGRWTFDPAIVLIAVVVLVAYLLAVARVRRVGGQWPPLRTACFAGPGVGLILLASVWWVGAYSRVLFWDFTVQVTLLLIVAPVFLAFGRPLTLAVAAGGRPAAVVTRVRSSRVFRFCAHPAFGPLLVPVFIFVLFFTGLLASTQRDAVVGEVVRVVFLLAGFVLALPLAGEEGGATTSLAIAAGLFLGFLELLLDAIPGILVRLRDDLLAPGYYGAVHRPWGPSPISDQRFGGAILWFVAEIIDLPFLILLVSRWIRVDAQEAARVDRELDALAAVRQPGPAASGERSRPAPVPPAPDRPVPTRAATTRLGPGPDAERSEEPERSRPWWETNPDYLGSTRAARFRKATAERDAGSRDPDA